MHSARPPRRGVLAVPDLNKPDSDRIGTVGEDDRNRGGRPLRCQRRLSARGDDDCHLAPCQIGCQRRQSIGLTLRVTMFDADISTFDEATFAQPPCAMRRNCASVSEDLMLKDPTAGIVDGCARAPSGHAATASPTRVIKSAYCEGGNLSLRFGGWTTRH